MPASPKLVEPYRTPQKKVYILQKERAVNLSLRRLFLLATLFVATIGFCSRIVFADDGVSAVILVHGVSASGNPNDKEDYPYATFDEDFAPNFLPNTIVIHFNWGKPAVTEGSVCVGTRDDLVRGLSDRGWRAVAKLKDVVARTR